MVKTDKKIERQRTPPSELILLWSHVTTPNQGFSLSHSLGTDRREPWERDCHNEKLYVSKEAKKKMLLHQRANHADQRTEIQ